jgi:hypothetical protein
MVRTESILSIGLLETYNRPAGILVLSEEGRSNLLSWDLGDHNFTYAQTAFCATVVVPQPQPGVRSLIINDTDLFANEVWLFGEGGVFFTPEENNIIRVDISGDPLARRKFCDVQGATESKLFIKTISGMGPNNYGDFKIVSNGGQAIDTVLRVEPINNGIQLKLVGGALQDADN